jgi:hypothetical protein
MNKKILILFIALGFLSGGIAVGMENGKGKKIQLTPMCICCGENFKDSDIIAVLKCGDCVCGYCESQMKECLKECFCGELCSLKEVRYEKFGNLKKRFSLYTNVIPMNISDKSLLNRFKGHDKEGRCLIRIEMYSSGEMELKKTKGRKYGPDYRLRKVLDWVDSFRVKAKQKPIKS